MPKRVKTVPPVESKERRAPACTDVGLEVKGKESEADVELIVIAAEDEGDDWKVPDIVTACSFAEDGG